MNQKVIVKAGTAGIGLEIVEAFAATGAKIFFLTWLRPEK